MIGRVVALRRFPVKSMGGESLEAAELGWTGLVGDREHAFVRTANTSDFPWLTGRQVPAMLLHRATWDGRRVHVMCPDGAMHDVTDPALATALEAAAGEPVRHLWLRRGCYDAMPISILTTALLAAISQAHGAALEALRFRANILVETDGSVDERVWAGATLAIGETRVRADWPIPRCAMITIDPATSARTPALQRTVAERFGNMAGIYGAVAAPGRMRVGDAVRFG